MDRSCEPEAEPHILGFLYWTINQIKTWELAEKRHIMARTGNFFGYSPLSFWYAPARRPKGQPDKNKNQWAHSWEGLQHGRNYNHDDA